MANQKMIEGFDYDSVNGYYVGGIFRKIDDVMQPISFEEYMAEEVARKNKEEEIRRMDVSRDPSIIKPENPGNFAVFREDETFEVANHLYERLPWVAVSGTIFCEPGRGPMCHLSQAVQHSFSVAANVSMTAKLSEMISVQVGFTWTWSWAYTTTYTFDLYPGKNAYIAVSGVGYHVQGNHKRFQNGNLIKQDWVDCISPDPNPSTVWVKAILV